MRSSNRQSLNEEESEAAAARTKDDKRQNALALVADRVNTAMRLKALRNFWLSELISVRSLVSTYHVIAPANVFFSSLSVRLENQRESPLLTFLRIYH